MIPEAPAPAPPTTPTSASIDTQYAQVCSQLGDLMCRRDDLYDAADDLARQIGTLKQRRAALGAQFAALKACEDAAAPTSTPITSPTLVPLDCEPK